MQTFPLPVVSHCPGSLLEVPQPVRSWLDVLTMLGAGCLLGESLPITIAGYTSAMWPSQPLLFKGKKGPLMCLKMALEHHGHVRIVLEAPQGWFQVAQAKLQLPKQAGCE